MAQTPSISSHVWKINNKRPDPLSQPLNNLETSPNSSSTQKPSPLCIVNNCSNAQCALDRFIQSHNFPAFSLVPWGCGGSGLEESFSRSPHTPHLTHIHRAVLLLIPVVFASTHRHRGTRGCCLPSCGWCTSNGRASTGETLPAAQRGEKNKNNFRQNIRSQNGVGGIGDLGAFDVRNWLALGDDGVRAAHVEGDGFHRGQHRSGSDHLGRFMDDVRGAEYWTDAVQGARLRPLAQPRPAGGQSAHRHRLRDGSAGSHGGDSRGAVHQLHPQREHQSPGGERRGCHLHHQRSVRAGAHLLDGQQHHNGLLQPAAAAVAEEGNRRGALHRLGRRGAAPDRRLAAVLLLSVRRQLGILGKIRTDQESRAERRLWQEELCVAVARSSRA